jgi:hypothetical protein
VRPFHAANVTAGKRLAGKKSVDLLRKPARFDLREPGCRKSRRRVVSNEQHRARDDDAECSISEPLQAILAKCASQRN